MVLRVPVRPNNGTCVIVSAGGSFVAFLIRFGRINVKLRLLSGGLLQDSFIGTLRRSNCQEDRYPEDSAGWGYW